MQTTILKKDFINALTIGGAMAGKNKTLPILESAKVEVSADTIAVHSFNGESWVTKQTKVRVRTHRLRSASTLTTWLRC
jgi:DNA polymerase III sliding clamp (beta) subunit (PCNA family)